MRTIFLIFIFLLSPVFSWASMPAPPSSSALPPVAFFEHIGDMPRVKYGTGKTNVIIVVDPLCPHCKNMLSEMPAYAKSHTFHIVLVSLLGAPSNNASRLLFCNSGKAVSLMTSGDRGRILSLPECSARQLVDFETRSERARWALSAWKIYAVPVIFTESGVREDGAAPLSKILHND